MAIRGKVLCLSFVQDGCVGVAGFNEDDVDSIEQEFAAERFGHAFQAVFGGGVGSQERRTQPATYGADVDDAAGTSSANAVCSKEASERLGDEHGCDEVDFKLAAEIGQGQVEEWSDDGDAGVVDEAGEIGVAEGFADLIGGALDRGPVGDIHQERREGRAELGLEAIGISLLSDGAEDVESLLDENSGGSPAYACGCSGDDDRFPCHVPPLHHNIRRTPYLVDSVHFGIACSQEVQCSYGVSF